MEEDIKKTEEHGGSGTNEVPKAKKANPFFAFFKKRWKGLLFLLILIYAGWTAFRVYNVVQDVKAESDVPEQSFASVERMDISNSIAVTGSIIANESRTISTLVSKSKVISVNVEVGDYVKKGDPICIFDTSNIEEKIAKARRQITINNAKATLDLAKANTKLAWTMEDALRDAADAGIDIEAAMRDYRQSEENVGNMEDDLQDAIDDLEDAEDEYDKAKKKYRNSTSENEAELESARDSAKKAVESAEKSVESARRSLVSAKYSLADQVDSYTKAVRSAEKTGIEDNRTISENMVSVLETELSNMTTNDDLEDQINDYETELNDCKVTAPISGIVTSVSVVEGDEYDEKSTICEIQDDTSYRVKATVDQYDIASVKEGMSCVVKTEATEDEEMTGTLTFVSPVPEGSSSTGSTGSSGSSGSGSSSTDYPIEISIDERDERIRIGMTAESSVLTDSRKGVLVVPYEAIQEDMDGSLYLNVANRNGDRDGGRPEKGGPGNGSHGKPGESGGTDTEASLVTMTAGAGREMAIGAQNSGSGESGLSKDEDVGNGRDMPEDGLNSSGDGLDMQMASFGGGVENKKNADASFGGGGGENEESADASFGEGGSENEENDDFSFDGNEPAVQTYSDDPVVNLIATIVLGKSAEQTYAEIPEIVPTRRVDITTGLETDYYTEILSGDISEGDEVLTSDEVSVSFDDESFSGGGFSLFGGGGRRPGGGGRRR